MLTQIQDNLEQMEVTEDNISKFSKSDLEKRLDYLRRSKIFNKKISEEPPRKKQSFRVSLAIAQLELIVKEGKLISNHLKGE